MKVVIARLGLLTTLLGGIVVIAGSIIPNWEDIIIPGILITFLGGTTAGLATKPKQAQQTAS
jgi:hypothetical protein